MTPSSLLPKPCSKFLAAGALMALVACGAPDAQSSAGEGPVELGTAQQAAIGTSGRVNTGSSYITVDAVERDYATLRLSLAAGQTRYLSSVVKLLNSNYWHYAVSHKIVCFPTGGDRFDIKGHVWTGRNIEGTSHAPTGTTKTLMTTARMLFQAPADGSYDCVLRLMLNDLGSGANEQVAIDAASTYVEEAGGLVNLPSSGPVQDQNEPRQLVPWGGAVNAAFLDSYVAAPGLTQLDVFSDVGVTNCRAGYQLCPDTETQVRSARVSHRLIIYQLDAAGGACATTYWPSSGYTVTDVPYVAHHAKIYMRHNAVPISTASNCTRRFKVYAQVVAPSSTSGYNRFEIEPSPYTLTFIRGLP